MARNRLKDLRRRVYQVLEQGPIGDGISSAVDRFLVALILVNLVAVALESIPHYEARYSAAFNLIEYFSLVVFTVEYGLAIMVGGRTWAAPAPGILAGASQICA